jgi:RNA polymerase sigma factor (sigma-70 family)
MTREETILSMEPKVRLLAKRAAKRVFNSDLAEIENEAWLGAIHAVDSYDPSRGTSLSTFAEHRIWGGILDYLRRIDHLSRSLRKEQRLGLVCFRRVSMTYAARTLCEESFLPEAETRADLDALFDRGDLKPREREILRRVYLDEEHMHAVAKSLGITQGRVSQICKRACKRLRAAA